MFSSTSQCSHLLHNVLTYSTMFSSTPQCSYLLHNVLIYSTMFLSNPQYSDLLHKVLIYSTVLSSIPQYSHVLHNVLIYSTMFLSTHVQLVWSVFMFVEEAGEFQEWHEVRFTLRYEKGHWILGWVWRRTAHKREKTLFNITQNIKIRRLL